MASSIPALASSLEKVAARLRRHQAGLDSDETATDMFRDLEEEDELEEPSEEVPPTVDHAAFANELARVEDFVARANSLPNDAKARSFREAIRVVLVCTEAGAKGLNLQFCETVINYDLPWNPQRIEQRIGRCHRYSQQRDVTVVNFIARDNEAHRLTFEILSQKLDLFGRVLDASDTVLHEPRTDAPEIVVSALSVEFETDLRNIYSRSRTLDEVTREIAALRDKIGERRDAYEKEYDRTSQIIESRFDENVRKVFKSLREELPHGLTDLDRDVADLVDGYLASRGVKYRRFKKAGRAAFEVVSGPALPAEIGDGRRFATGDPRSLTDAEALNLVHPLLLFASARMLASHDHGRSRPRNKVMSSPLRSGRIS